MLVAGTIGAGHISLSLAGLMAALAAAGCRGDDGYRMLHSVDRIAGQSLHLGVGFGRHLNGPGQAFGRPPPDITLCLFHQPRLHAKLLGDLRR